MLSFRVDMSLTKEGADVNGGLEDTTGGNRPLAEAPLGDRGGKLESGYTGAC